VVVEDHDVQSQAPRELDLLPGARAAIQCNQQRRATISEGFDGTRVQPVPLSESIGKVGDDVAPELPNGVA